MDLPNQVWVKNIYFIFLVEYISGPASYEYNILYDNSLLLGKHLSIYLSSIYLSIYLSISISIYHILYDFSLLFGKHLSIYLYTYIYIYISIYHILYNNSMYTYWPDGKHSLLIKMVHYIAWWVKLKQTHSMKIIYLTKHF